MIRSKFLANILFYLVRSVALILFFIGIYALIILSLSLYTHTNGLPIEVKDTSFIIFYPFTKIPFLAGDHTTEYLISSSVITILYGWFLWLLGGVFNAYRMPKLFILKNVNRLKAFYIFNFITPLAILSYLLITGEPVQDVLVIIFLHLMLGVFIYFMAEIFKQGLLLQEEQDLTL